MRHCSKYFLWFFHAFQYHGCCGSRYVCRQAGGSLPRAMPGLHGRCKGPLCLNASSPRRAQTKYNNQCSECFHSLKEPVAPRTLDITLIDRSYPNNACINHPMCKKQRRSTSVSKRIITSCGDQPSVLAGMQKHCASCQKAHACEFPECPLRAAPAFRRKKQTTPQFCAVHYRDPCNAPCRDWNLCSNARVGCQQLALMPTSGKCFACSNGYVPCCNALLGCPAFVSIHGTKKRKACRRDDDGCPFAPDRPGWCRTPWCSNRSSSASKSVCTDCESGLLPCANNCSRRSVPGNSGHCARCVETGISRSTASAKPLSCATARCTNVPTLNGHCFPCARGLLPCASPSCCMRAPIDNDSLAVRHVRLRSA